MRHIDYLNKNDVLALIKVIQNNFKSLTDLDEYDLDFNVLLNIYDINDFVLER